MKVLHPFFIIVALVLAIGIACSFGGSTDTPAPPPTQPPVEQPTKAPVVEQPTEAPPPEPTATEEPAAPAAQEFFTEEFDNPLSSDWSTLTVTGSDNADPDKVKVAPEDGKLVWNFDSEYVYYYLFYEAFKYEDVRIEVSADNRGKNNNSISLICRYDAKVGWYEFNIANNGLYDISYAEVTKSGKIDYTSIVNGGSKEIKQGKGVNEYAAVCQGNELSLYINGEEVKSVKENKFALRDGKVGVSVSSFNVLPIIIEMDWIKIIEP
jgi:hypothetical protein